MNSSEWVLKAILNRYPADLQEQLLRLLPREEAERLDAMPSLEVETDVEEPPLLDRIHWSWLLPFLKPLTVREQKLFLGALSSQMRENLCRELKIKTPPPEESNRAVKEFAMQILTESLAGEPVQLLPVYFLPPTPLSPLLHLDKQILLKLIDFLSLNDLAMETRQIVETKILKKIYSFLSEEEKKFLKKAANVKQPYPTARLQLEKWDGTEASLRLLLHRRGLARLGQALYAQHPDFIWYICHQLDIGRGKALEKHAVSDAGSASQKVAQYVEELLKEML